MKPGLFLSLACALLSPIPALAQAGPAEIEILHATSGVFSQSDNSFRPTRDVSLTSKDAHGWIMQVRTSKPVIRWREEFTLPARAANWNLDGDSQTIVADDGRTSVTEREVEASDGWIANAWTATPRGGT